MIGKIQIREINIVGTGQKVILKLNKRKVEKIVKKILSKFI